MLIDGELTAAENGATYPDISPLNGEEIARAPDASLRDLDRAIAAARRAFDATDWSSNHAARVAKLRVFADLIRKNRDRLADLARDEVGAPMGCIYSAHCDWPLGGLDFAINLAQGYAWEEDLGLSTGPTGLTSHRKVWKEPVGVVAAITPWNVPTQINLAKVVPALAAGCTVILKPAPETPMLATILGELAVEAGLPRGVFNVVTSASPAEIGEALVKDPRVDLISFTGSTATGKRIMANASEKLARVFLELGGKSALIVLDDADFATAVSMGAGVVYNAGQGCASLTRLLVPKARQEEAVAILKSIMEQIPYGDPASPMQIMGPLISERQRQRVQGYIEAGKQEGARLVTGGKAPPQFDKGYWFEPTLFADVTNDMRIAQEEIFGPVLVVIGFEDDEDAIRIANDSVYGLSGGVFSADPKRAEHVARKVRTGTFSINGGMWYAADSPFGGFKQSGIGREMGREGFEEYLELKTVASPQ
jgi:aldehyde dehydrogenase (NAD+)